MDVSRQCSQCQSQTGRRACGHAASVSECRRRTAWRHQFVSFRPLHCSIQKITPWRRRRRVVISSVRPPHRVVSEKRFAFVRRFHWPVRVVVMSSWSDRQTDRRPCRAPVTRQPAPPSRQSAAAVARAMTARTHVWTSRRPTRRDVVQRSLDAFRRSRKPQKCAAAASAWLWPLRHSRPVVGSLVVAHYPAGRRSCPCRKQDPVSYTHLTLPTIYSV